MFRAWLILGVLLLFFGVSINAQTAYYTNSNRIYYVDISTFNIYDSADVGSRFDFEAIATGIDGKVYGKNKADNFGSIDSLSVFDPVVKSYQFKCLLDDVSGEYEYGLCFDDSDRIVVFGTFFPTAGFAGFYDKNSCALIKTGAGADAYRTALGGALIDHVYLNGMHYVSGFNGNIYQIDNNAGEYDDIPLIFRMPDSLRAYNMPGLFAVCKNDTTFFYGILNIANTQSPSRLIEINPVTGRSKIIKQYSQFFNDAAFYSNNANFFYLGPDDTLLCDVFSKTLKTYVDNTVWSTGQTGAQITVTTPGTYWARVTNACGTYTDTIRLDTITPKISLGRDTFLCQSQYYKIPRNTALASIYCSGYPDSILITQDTMIYACYYDKCPPQNYQYDTQYVYLYAPDGNFIKSNKPEICVDSAVVLTSKYTTTRWFNGFTGASVTVNAPGKYWAEVNTPCGTRYDTIEIKMAVVPVLDIGRDSILCSPAYVSGVSPYPDTYWVTSFGVVKSNSYSVYAQVDTFIAAFYVHPCFPSDTVRDTMFIKVLQSAIFNITANSNPFCNRNSVQLSSNFGVSNWSTGQQAASITVNAPGQYWAEFTNACGIYSDTIYLDTIAQQRLNSFGDTLVCEGSILKYSSNLPNIVWNGRLADSIIFVAIRDTIIYISAPTSCFTGDSLRDTLYVRVDLNSALNVYASSLTFCSQPVVLIKDNPAAIWYDGSVSDSLLVNSSGKFWASYQNACGVFSDTLEIKPYSALTLSIGRDTVLCPNSSMVLYSNISGTIWSTGDTAAQIQVVSPGLYWAKADDSCETLTDTILVTAYVPDNIQLSGDTTVCPFIPVVIYSNQDSTIWGSNIIAPEIQIMPSKDTLVVGMIPNVCAVSGFSQDTVLVSVIVDSVLVVTSSALSLCDSEFIQISSTVFNTLWLLPDSTVAAGDRIAVNKAGQYWASYTGICNVQTDSINLMQLCTDECTVYIPTAFTPNGDGVNDNFGVFTDCGGRLLSFNLKIFNRWGELVFECLNTTEAWTGYYKGVPAMVDDYSWLVEMEYTIDNKVRRFKNKGIVTLLR